MDESPPPRWQPKSLLTYRRIATALYGYAGIINPIICFACAAPSGNWLADRPWQSGEFWVYATLMMKWPAVLPFYPVLLYSMTCLGLLLWNWQRFARHFAVRIGVYGGVPLSILFGGLLFGTANQPARALLDSVIAFVIIAISTLFGLAMLAAVFHVLRPRVAAVAETLGGCRGLIVMSAGVIVAFVGMAFLFPGQFENVLGGFVFFPLITILACGPTWSLLAYSSASIELLVRKRPDKWRWKITDALLLTGWIAAAFAAWRKAMDLAIEEYATLPTENPSCFICAAAARGHGLLVRSEAIAFGDQRRLVTQQLRVLKAAELALWTLSPTAHRLSRKAYNFVGPIVARSLRNRWLADAAYLALKPAEWLAAIGLRVLLGVDHEKTSRLYAHRLGRA